jgi:hypothetical protein
VSMRDHLGGGSGPKVAEVAAGPSMAKIAVLVATLAGLIAVLGVLYFKSRASFVPTSAETLCPIDRPPTAVLAVLLDTSDAVNETQKTQIVNELERIWSKVPTFGRIDIFPIDRVGARTIESVATICNPGSDKDINRLYQNPKFARLKWAQFREQLDKAVQQQIRMDSSDRSPIFEAVQSIAIQDFNKPDHDAVPKSLVAVSDLVQHHPGRLSFYEKVPIFEEFRKTDYYQYVRADLAGADVVLIHLVRSRFDPVEIVQFWEDYLHSQRAQVVLVAPIYGEE